ncbi:OB-fold domain-containing protein [Marivibrio halodurans]|uniref:OB-fold domain-containing protein n=1 Tax=Marivibrio halodurans TaxID=2039722 RepID=A0A8J7SPC8_9PROT|nr:OB-fold domain-containing protein [Marivibrio halodurans]MBP5858558.1 OB-fold domain-containing protein [Marivibrio halodurans]
MELMTRKEVWNITYNHALGKTASEFFTQIKESARILGRRCPSDGRVLVPPRAFSDESLEATDEWVEVGPGGRIEAFTITYEPFQNLPEPPYAFGYVLLDGASTAIGGYFKGIDLSDPARAAEKLVVGTRVKTCFAEEKDRIGDVLDFWFEVQD